MSPGAKETFPVPRGWWKLPVLSGVMLGCSYLPGPWLILNFGSLVPLLAWLHSRPETSAYHRLRAGFVFGLVMALIGLHFMYSMLVFSWLALVLYFGLAVLLAMRLAVSVALMGWLRRRTGLPWALLLPISWLPFEWLETWGDLRLTADHLACSMAGYPFLVGFADVLGPYGIGAFLLVVNGLVFESLVFRGRREGRRALLALVLVAAAVLAYDGWAWARETGSGRMLRVGLVQPNIALEVKHDPATSARQWEVLARLSAEAARQGAELIVWPETARPAPLYHRLDRPETWAMPDVQALARQLQVTFLVGVEYARIHDGTSYDLYNAAVAVDSGGRLLDRWTAKVYLVPFTEMVPFRRILGPLIEGKKGEWRWLAGGFTPGPPLDTLDVAGARVGVLVCYEQLFPELSRELRNRGAELQVVITDDAWWGRSFFQVAQANVLRLRAIESRTSFVRVANTGISGFVDTRGRYHHRTKLFTEAVEVHDVRLTTKPTLYDRFGDLVAWLALAGLGSALFLSVRSRNFAG